MGFPAEIYQPTYMWLVFGLCVLMFFNFSSSNSCNKLLEKQSVVPVVILIIFLIFFVGLRPVSFRFGDTVNYAYGYNLSSIPYDVNVDFSKEWFWQVIEQNCKRLGMNVNQWFLIVEIGYLGFVFLAIRKMLWESPFLAMMFFLSAFSTWTYAVNGMRNGFACSMLTLAIAIIAENKSKIWLAGGLAILALGVHKSTMLPLAACLASVYFIRNPKWLVYFWLLSIPVSFVAGTSITSVFAGLGFDDRMDSYTSGDNSEGTYTTAGFRWDFLLYSSMPVLLIWYVTKKVKDSGVPALDGNPAGTGVVADANSLRVFNVLANTYLMANAFWVMMIRANFSNRFAYLSWFLYPIVMAYGVIRLHIWPDQDRKAGLILLAHAGFTIIMYMLGKL